MNPDHGTPAPSSDSAGTASNSDAPVVDVVDGQLVQKAVSYNKPDVLRMGRSTEVQLIINVLGGSLLSQFSNLPGEVQGHAIAVSKEMSADLSGPADRVQIRLRPGVAPWQRLTTAGNPTWNWDVTALTPGTANLDLTIRAKLAAPDGAIQQTIVTYHDTIPVKVGVIDTIKWWIGQVDPIWKWLTGVAVALGGAVVWWRTNIRRKA